MLWCFLSGILILHGCAMAFVFFFYLFDSTMPIAITEALGFIFGAVFLFIIGALMVRRGQRVSKPTPQDLAKAAERQRLAEEQERLRQQELAKKRTGKSARRTDINAD